MFKFRSKVMFISAIIGTLYMFYITSYFLGGISSTDGAEQVGSAIATALVLPHMLLLILAVIFNWVGFFMNKKWAAVTCGVLYSVSGVAFIIYIFFEIPMIVLSFVGIGKINKIEELKKMDVNSSSENEIVQKNDESDVKNNKPFYLKAWFVVLMIIVALGLFGIFAGGDSTDSADNELTQVESTDSDKETNSKPKKNVEPIDVTVSEIYELLETNALKASKTYKNVYVRLTGELSNIDSSGEYISLSPMNDEYSFNSVMCYIDEKHLDAVMNFEDGQILTVIGTITDVGEVLGYYMDVESFSTNVDVASKNEVSNTQADNFKYKEFAYLNLTVDELADIVGPANDSMPYQGAVFYMYDNMSVGVVDGQTVVVYLHTDYTFGGISIGGDYEDILNEFGEPYEVNEGYDEMEDENYLNVVYIIDDYRVTFNIDYDLYTLINIEIKQN